MATAAKLILTLVFIITYSTLIAQKPGPATSKPITIQKFKPPVLTTMLGIRSDTASVYVEEAVQLIRLPLKITDDKKKLYTVSSYQFMYKSRAVTEDEETGKVTPIISNVSDLFKITPLPELWIRTLTERLRVGEEIHFFDIVVKDAQGRLMFAPELRIKIKK